MTIYKVISLFLILTLIINISSHAQKNYEKNPHVKIEQKIENGKYIIDYTFKDQWEEFRTFHFEFNVDQTKKKIKQLY